MAGSAHRAQSWCDIHLRFRKALSSIALKVLIQTKRLAVFRLRKTCGTGWVVRNKAERGAMENENDGRAVMVINVEAGKFIEVIEEASTPLREVVKLPQGLTDGLIRLRDSPVEFCRIERLAATGTDELRLGLQPSGHLLGLVAALRALKNEAGVIQESGHKQAM